MEKCWNPSLSLRIINGALQNWFFNPNHFQNEKESFHFYKRPCSRDVHSRILFIIYMNSIQWAWQCETHINITLLTAIHRGKRTNRQLLTANTHGASLFCLFQCVCLEKCVTKEDFFNRIIVRACNQSSGSRRQFTTLGGSTNERESSQGTQKSLSNNNNKEVVKPLMKISEAIIPWEKFFSD
jgi:hypothetical protein